MAPRYTDQILEVRRALWKFEARQTDPMIKSHCRIIRGISTPRLYLRMIQTFDGR